MATMLGLDPMMMLRPRDNLDSHDTPELSVTGPIDGLSAVSQDSLLRQESSSQAEPPLPPPNPYFVFPARSASSSAPSSYSRASGRRAQAQQDETKEEDFEPTSDSEIKQNRSPALPDFSFNPGASLACGNTSAETSSMSSPQSPASSLLSAVRPAGHRHRRGGSEFVGGNMRAGDSITVTGTSPTKSDSGLTSPTLSPSRLRGRHAHRRSTAISSHDLSSNTGSPLVPITRGGSAPTSPSSTNNFGDCPLSKFQTSQAELSFTPTSDISHQIASPELESRTVQLQQPPRPANRARVGFSDTLEFIPRPLSLISSDASSVATIRPGGHSVSGSITSLVSMTNADRDVHSSPQINFTRKPLQRRPSTAGAVLERNFGSIMQDAGPQSPRRQGPTPLLGLISPEVPSGSSPPSPMKPMKRWSFFGLDNLTVTNPPTRTRPTSPASPESQMKRAASFTSLGHTSDSSTQPDEGSESVSTKCEQRKRSMKSKKVVKMWAGSILARNPKGRQAKQKRRAPMLSPNHDKELGDDGTDETTEMALEPEAVTPSSTCTDISFSGLAEPWEPAEPRSVPDEDLSYPMIDLDAALGPFNTPLPRNLEWEAAQRAGGLVKKQLHSAAGMTRFTGPGMHYSHRRAESAPEMVPFEAGRFGIHRFGSNSTMADVFEEDEEEDVDVIQDKTPGQSTPTAETPILETAESPFREYPQSTFDVEVVAPRDRTTATTAGAKSASSDLSEWDKSQRPPRTPLEQASSALQGEVNAEELLGHSFASYPILESSPQVHQGKDSESVDVSPLHLPTSASLPPVSPYSMTQGSSFSSPRSPMSYDAQRLSTAPSSVATDDNFQSLLLGEPGPELRLSVDITPSVTSSRSTLTRESSTGQTSSNQTRHAKTRPLFGYPRPASFTSTTFGRRRSSLASLSRLVNSSHASHSPLQREVPLEGDIDKRTKMSKTKRLSRMVQFWKTRESDTSA